VRLQIISEDSSKGWAMHYVTGLCSVVLLLAWGGVTDRIAAESSLERMALSVAGPDCSSQRRSIGLALTEIPGVHRVDFESVPDHVLIDVTHPSVTLDTLTTAARGSMAAGSRCRIETMKSCISANRVAVGR
jgi:hypothetical protein